MNPDWITTLRHTLFGKRISWEDELYILKPFARDLLALQQLAVLTLSLTAVFIPATFSIVWLLNTLGAVSKTTADSIGIPAISTISGTLSAAVGYLKFRRELGNEEKVSPAP